MFKLPRQSQKGLLFVKVWTSGCSPEHHIVPRRYFRQMKGLDSTTHVRSEEKNPDSRSNGTCFLPMGRQNQNLRFIKWQHGTMLSWRLHRDTDWREAELYINAEPIDSQIPTFSPKREHMESNNTTEVSNVLRSYTRKRYANESKVKSSMHIGIDLRILQ